MDWLKCINSFQAVVNQQSFVKAADSLHKPQSAVSKEVSWLENQLEVRLLLRTTRELKLTEQGHIFFQLTKDFLKHWEEVKTKTLSQTDELYGNLNIVTSSTTSERLLLALIPAFLKQYQQIQIDYSIYNHSLDLIRENIDVYITSLIMPISKLVMRETLTTLKSHLIASPKYLANHGKPRSIKELSKHNCLIYTLQDKAYLWQFANGKSIEVSGNFQANNMQSIINAAIQDLGIAFIPKLFVKDELTTHQLEIILPSHYADQYEIYAYYQRSAYKTGIAMTFINYLKSQIAFLKINRR